MKPQPLIIIAPVNPEFIKLLDGRRGEANGYVALPKGHPWYEMDYADIPCDVHGGLTFAQPCNIFESDYWMIGFDTAHCDDTKEMWPIFRVFNEAKRLWDQVMEVPN
jgi:hypothetical protein